VVPGAVRNPSQHLHGLAVQGGDPLGHGRDHRLQVQVEPFSAAAALPDEAADQSAVAASDVQDPGARTDHGGDDVQVLERPRQAVDAGFRQALGVGVRGGEERGQHAVELVHLQQESVVSVGARQFAEGDGFSQFQQRLGDPPGLRSREEPVRREGHDQVAAAGTLEGLPKPPAGGGFLRRKSFAGILVGGNGIRAPAVARREIEPVHGLGDVQVAVGVETLHEPFALVLQVLLDLEGGVEAVGLVVLTDPPSELPRHALGREVGDVGDLPGQGKPADRAIWKDVFPSGPSGIVEDGFAFHHVEGKGLGGKGRRRRHADAAFDAVGVAKAPFQGLHPAHGTAEHGVQGPDAQMVQEQPLHFDHVADRDVREAAPEGFARGGIRGRRSRRARAAAEHAGANHEPTPGIHRLSRSDHLVPPPLGADVLPRTVETRHMAASGQGRSDEDGVPAVRIQGSIRFVGDLEAVQRLSGFADEPSFRERATQETGFHHADRARPVVGLGPIRHPTVVGDAHGRVQDLPANLDSRSHTGLKPSCAPGEFQKTAATSVARPGTTVAYRRSA